MPTDTELRDPASQPPPTAPGDSPVAGPRSSRRRDALIVVVTLLVGMGAVAGFGALTGSDDETASATIDADIGPATPLPDGDSSAAPGTPAASPQAAVESFLDAEAEGDFETSYDPLSEAQRATYGSAAAWTSAHADFFPVVGHRIVDATDGSVTAEVEYRSSLDEVVGLVPARGVVDWVVVEAAGGWTVDFDASAVTPVYPDDSTAADAVVEWAAANQRCEEPTQYDGALVATADLLALVDSMCETSDPVGTGAARTLDEFDATPFVSAFGTDALAWARAVELTGPVDLTVVVAPVDDDWIVVGLLPA